MPIDLATLAELREFVAAMGKATFSGLNFDVREAFHGKRATFIAGAGTHISAQVDSVGRDVHPLTAGEGKPIGDWGRALQVERKGATPARKSAAGRVRGNAGEVAPALSQLVHDETGLVFELEELATIPGVFGVDPPSFVDVGIAGVDVGSQTRLKKGSVLKFISPVPGILSEVVLQLDLDEDGFDVEQFGGYRDRVLGALAKAPSGGNADDFVRWAKESLASVRTAYSYPNRGGRGTIDVAAFYAASGSSRALTSDDRDAVLEYIKTKAPFQVGGDGGGLRVLLTVPDPQRVEIRLETNGVLAFRFDWDDSAGYEVLSWNATTRELQFAGGALPASLRAGHSLLFDPVASAQDGTEYRIEAISAVDKVILEVAPPVAPAATDLIWSGGPLVTPVRDAVVAHLNGEIVYAGRGLTPLPESTAAEKGVSIIGLDTLAEGIGAANPDGKYGAFSGSIVRALLFKIATYKAGVRNATIVSPASDYSPLDDPFPTDDQIHYVTPGAVIIRSA